MNKKKLIILVIIGLVILLVGIFFSKKNHINNKFEVLDTTYTCAEALETFWEDDKYTYTFPCIKSSYVYIKFPDGNKVLVVKALKDKLITIEELEKSDLEFYKNKK